MAGQPLRVTVSTVWHFHVDPPPQRPPTLSVADLVTCTLFTLLRVIVGAVYFHDCPQHPNIPNYLLGQALFTLLMVPFVTLPCESVEARENPRGFKLCLLVLISSGFFIWCLGGVVLVFSAYQPNYDPTAADGLYCNKTLYTFAFWNAVLEILSCGTLLAKGCRSFLVGVSIHRSPGHSNV